MNLPFIRSMAVLERIWNGDGMGKYGEDAWRSRPDHVDAAASERHGRAHNEAVGLVMVTDDDLPLQHEPSCYDHDSGEPALAHRIVRDLCRLERFLLAEDAKNGET